MDQGLRVYGIVERTDDAAAFTGCWQRIEIVAPEWGAAHINRVAETTTGRGRGAAEYGKMVVLIRYLDAGGTDIKEVNSIFQIHAKLVPFEKKVD